MVEQCEAKPAQEGPLDAQAAEDAPRSGNTVKCSARRRDGQQGRSVDQTAASQSLSMMFGLDPRAALLTVLIDLLLFGGDLCTFGGFIPIAAVVAAALGFIVYKIQTRWYHDDRESAQIKAAIVALLTAIPVPIAPLLAIPCGVLGIIKTFRRK